MTIDCILASNREAHTLLADNRLCELCGINTLWMNFLWDILWTFEAHLIAEGVFSVHSSYLPAQDDPHDIHKIVYRMRFSFHVRVSIVGGILLRPCPPPARMTPQGYRNFLKILLKLSI